MSNFILTEDKGALTIQMARGKGNPLNEAFLVEFTKILNDARNNSNIKGLMISGQPHYFSVGLDLIELYDYTKEEFDQFWAIFQDFMYALASFPKPVISAITGHAPAGGCVIAICTDYRVMAEGKYKIGLNEIPVGIIVPPSVIDLYAFWLGNGNASRFVLEGKMHTVGEALACGLIDEAVSLDQVEATAMKQLVHYMRYHQGAWGQTKLNARKDLLEKMTPKRDTHFLAAMDQWWKPEVRANLKAYIDSFAKKAKS